MYITCIINKSICTTSILFIFDAWVLAKNTNIRKKQITRKKQIVFRFDVDGARVKGISSSSNFARVVLLFNGTELRGPTIKILEMKKFHTNKDHPNIQLCRPFNVI